ncbi:MAG: glutaredoxin 2 [Alphaproteobacteria bacterium]
MKLFVYEHCPYCVRPRVVLGYKGIECDIEYLLDDDIDGHIEKVGSKQVPILQKDDGSYMAESLDIVKYFDSLDGNPIFKKTSGRSDIENIFNEMRDEFRTLVFSYLAEASFGELKTESARQHFINRYLKHINVDSLDEAISKRQQHKQVVEQTMIKMNDLIYSKEHISEGGLSMDDVVYFADLHRMSIVPDLNMPENVRGYMEYQLSKNNCNIVYV